MNDNDGGERIVARQLAFDGGSGCNGNDGSGSDGGNLLFLASEWAEFRQSQQHRYRRGYGGVVGNSRGDDGNGGAWKSHQREKHGNVRIGTQTQARTHHTHTHRSLSTKS